MLTESVFVLTLRSTVALVYSCPCIYCASLSQLTYLLHLIFVVVVVKIDQWSRLSVVTDLYTLLSSLGLALSLSLPPPPKCMQNCDKYAINQSR